MLPRAREATRRIGHVSRSRATLGAWNRTRQRLHSVSLDVPPSGSPHSLTRLDPGPAIGFPWCGRPLPPRRTPLPGQPSISLSPPALPRRGFSFAPAADRGRRSRAMVRPFFRMAHVFPASRRKKKRSAGDSFHHSIMDGGNGIPTAMGRVIMEFRWVVFITLWTMLSGPVFYSLTVVTKPSYRATAVSSSHQPTQSAPAQRVALNR